MQLYILVRFVGLIRFIVSFSGFLCRLGFGFFILTNGDVNLAQGQKQQWRQKAGQQGRAGHIICEHRTPFPLADRERAAGKGRQLVLRGGIMLVERQCVAFDLVACAIRLE